MVVETADGKNLERGCKVYIPVIPCEGIEQNPMMYTMWIDGVFPKSRRVQVAAAPIPDVVPYPFYFHFDELYADVNAACEEFRRLAGGGEPKYRLINRMMDAERVQEADAVVDWGKSFKCLKKRNKKGKYRPDPFRDLFDENELGTLFDD